jgi:glycosyltransferase involved in cell wall biosynthesis
MKVAVYAIAKDEAKHVARWLESCAGADVVLLVDTGSTDGTLEALGEAAETSEVRDVRCVVANVVPWRFDDARNTALSLVPRDVDWCITLDLDEVLTDGWREKFERAVTQAPDAAWVRYGYVWNWNPDGTPKVHFRSMRTHRREGFRWVFPCHETLMTYSGNPQIAEFEGDMIHHHADETKSRADYLRLLETAVAENPTSKRCELYLRREKLLRLTDIAGSDCGMAMVWLAFAWDAFAAGLGVEGVHALTMAKDRAVSEHEKTVVAQALAQVKQ